MTIHRGYSSIACLFLCSSQSTAFVAKNNNFGTTMPFQNPTSKSLALPSTHRQKYQCSRLFSSSTDLNSALVTETSHLPRLYVDSPSLLEKSLVSLSPFQTNYLSVMRVTNTKRWGQWTGHVRIFNGKDGEWLAKVIINESSDSKSKKRRKDGGGGDSTILECVQQTIPQPSFDNWEVHLHMGRIKKQRRKWVLEKTTELGITSIEAVDMEYSDPKEPWEHDKHLAQVIEAAEQCERLTVPTLTETSTSWSDLLERIEESKSSADEDHHWLVCRERSINVTLPILSALEDISASSKDDKKISVHILVGPEGGWSPTELADLQAQSNGNLHFVSLGSLVLRAETATIAAVTAAMLTIDKKRS